MTQDQTQQDDAAAPQSELAQTKAQLAAMTETAQRALADLQNFKRRAEEERGELQVYANMKLLQAIFPALDSFTRAFDNLPEELTENEWVKGIVATEANLLSALTSLGLEAIDETGVPVDPMQHEVLMEGDGPAGEVVQIFEKGFRFKDKTVRPAKVMVGKTS